MKILITGIDGFVGAYMAKLCLEKGADVYGTTYKDGTTEGINSIKDKVKLTELEITNEKEVMNLIKDINPDWIIHLAAQTFVPASWDDPNSTFKINVIGTSNLFEAIRKNKLNPRIIISCAANEYGYIKENEVPITEETKFNPDNPYAVSKIAVDMMAYQYFISHKLKTIRVRPFNMIGPEQSTRFVASDFAKQIAEIEKGKRKPVMMVGNLEAKRDFIDIRDAVKAFWLLMEKGKEGDVYNICSGNGVSIKELLDMLLKLSKVKIEVKQDLSKMRPSDVPIIVGTNKKLRDIGWKQEISLEQTLKDILNYWREKV